MVDLVPNLTAHNSCIKVSSCSFSCINPKSFLAKANVSLPVVGYSFKGTSIPCSSNSSANCLLLANFLRTHYSSSQFSLTFKLCNNFCFSSFTSSKRVINKASSTLKVG